MAEALFRTIGDERISAASAGSDPGAGVHPLAVEALGELGIDWRGRSAKGIGAVQNDVWDAVITVCDAARDACPYMPTAGLSAHWGLEDPAATPGDHAAQLQAFRHVRDVLSDAVTAFFTEISNSRDDPPDLRSALLAGSRVVHASSISSSSDSLS